MLNDFENGRLGPAERPVARFGNPGAVRCERAAGELRAGRPIRVVDGRKVVAALALDTASPATFHAFKQASDGRERLYLTPPRARVLGLDAPDGALVPLSGLSFDEVCRLGYMRETEAPVNWEPGTKLCAEASGLARLGLLLPAILVADITPGDPGFSDCVEVRVGDLGRGWMTAAQDFEIVTRTPVPLKGIASAEFIVFRGGFAQRDQIAIVVGKPDPSRSVPVRVHSSCLTGDLFGSLKCDCGDQLRAALRLLQEKGGGVLLYLDQEGRGTGIASKMRAYRLQCEGLDTVDADAELGFGADERRYEAAVAMLTGLGLTSIELLTNNPHKIAYLRASGIEVVGRTPVLGEVTPENRSYLRTKVTRSGHLMDLDALVNGQ